MWGKQYLVIFDRIYLYKSVMCVSMYWIVKQILRTGLQNCYRTVLGDVSRTCFLLLFLLYVFRPLPYRPPYQLVLEKWTSKSRSICYVKGFSINKDLKLHTVWFAVTLNIWIHGKSMYFNYKTLLWAYTLSQPS